MRGVKGEGGTQRVEPVRKFAVLATLLEEAEFVGDHDLNETREDEALGRLDNLGVDLLSPRAVAQ